MKIPFKISFDIEGFVLAIKLTAIIAGGIVAITLSLLFFNGNLSYIHRADVWTKVGIGQLPLIMAIVMPIYPAIFIKPVDESKSSWTIRGLVVLLISAFAYYWLTYFSVGISYPTRSTEDLVSTSYALTGIFVLMNVFIHGLSLISKRSTP